MSGLCRVLGAGARLQELANADDQHGTGGSRHVVQPGMADGVVVQQAVVDDGLASDPADQGSAQCDDDGEALHELDHQRGAEDHQRDADGQAQDQQDHVALRRGGHGDHVVQAHHQVGDQDGADGDHHAAMTLGFAFILFFAGQQLQADPQQQAAAHDLQEGQLQQLGRDHGQDDPQHHGGAGAEHDGFLLLCGGQRACCEGDDDGVVARQDDVDPDDLQQADPEIGALQVFHGFSAVMS